MGRYKVRLAAAVFGILSLAGCATLAIEGVNAAGSEAIIAVNIDAARGGDAEAQYRVGRAYCCSLHEGSGLYNTRTAVEWLCSSARQSYAPAMVMLGKIYSGDVIDGVKLTRRALQGLAGTSTNLPVALVWLRLAEDRGEEDALSQAEGALENLSEADRARMEEIYAQGLAAPCEWDEVIET